MCDTEAALLETLVQQAQAEVEAAVRGASLCSVSREPGRGASDVKVHEGRWYTLRDIQRDLEHGSDAATAMAHARIRVERRTPAGDSWADYRRGAFEALQQVQQVFGLRE